jgi:hypothetical protein
MPSIQDCAERLREQAYKTLMPQIRDLERELQRFSASLSDAIAQLGRKIEVLRNIELPTAGVILDEILGEFKAQRDQEAVSLALFAEGLRQKETQEEILSFLLDGAHRHFSRAALFSVRKDRFAGWSSRGFPEDKARSIASCSFLRSDYPKLDEVLSADQWVTASAFIDDGGPLHFIREQDQEPWHILPLRALQRPVAAILAGGAENAPSCRDSLFVMAALAVLRLENIALRILYEMTASRPEAAPAPSEAIARTAVVEQAPAPEAAEVPAGAEAQIIEEKAAAEPEEAAPEEIEEAPAEPVAAPQIPAAMEAEEKPSAPMEAAQETPAAAPRFEPVVLKPQEPLQVGEEEKLHADAKRFARLLVSEIKLYNERHVVEGRENRDLYIRLKRDIDRSREMYEKRVSPTVARKIDYFHDEIIRILGDNDPSTLGSDYPGPRVIEN